MSRRTRQPETKTLHISQGDWLLVKMHPTAGDERAIFRDMMREGATVDRLDQVKVGMSRILHTLLDWSFTDHNDKPLVIRDQSKEDREAALNAIDPEDFIEVLDAIDQHRDAMEKLRVAEKNARAGANGSSPISPSLVSSTGDMSGLPSLTEMSTTS